MAPGVNYTRGLLKRFLLALAILLLLALAWSGIQSGVDQLSQSPTPGQKVQTATQFVFGVLSLLVGASAFRDYRFSRVARWAWVAAVTSAAALAPVVWGEEPWATGVVAGISAFAVALLILWMIRIGTSPMSSLFDPHARARILDRISQLTPDRRPGWGRFTASEMVCHVSSGLRQGLGELDAGPPSGPWTSFPLNWFVIHVLPWPKGRGQSPPEFLATRPTSWTADVGALRDLVQRFGARGPSAAWPPSRAFGAISGRSWGVLQHKHLDYHLRQFGV